jgi:sulfide dehydrogenase cytochrome subunit
MKAGERGIVMRLILVNVFAVFFVLPITVAAAELDELLIGCDGCHGPNGVSVDDDVPTIAGQNEDFIDETLHSYQVWGRPCITSAYRHGDTSRPATDMCRVAGKLSNQDIMALAQHYGKQTFVAAQQPFDADQVETGAALHQQHCESCHNGGGAQPGPGPILAGQWTPYLKATLKYVPTGEHLVPPMMERKLADFSAQEIDALMNYYASQQD